MITRKSWEEFRDSGLFWFINSILHLFGWVIVLKIENDTITDVYPARTKFRGFNQKANDNGYRKVTEYLKENIDELLEEADDIGE